MIALSGNREVSKSVWAYPNTGGASPTWSADTGANTYSVAVDSSDNVYVVGVNSGAKNVWKYDSSGTLVGSYNAGGTTVDANCVALDSNGRIIVGHDAVSDACYTVIAADMLSDTSFTTGFTGDQGMRAGVDTSDNIYILVLASNLRGTTREKWNSSLVRQWTGTSGAGSDISLPDLGLAVHPDGDITVWFTYSSGAATIWTHYKSATGNSDGTDNDTTNELKGMGVDADGAVWMGTDSVSVIKQTHTDGVGFNDVLEVPGEDIYSNFFTDGTTLWCATWGLPGG